MSQAFRRLNSDLVDILPPGLVGTKSLDLAFKHRSLVKEYDVESNERLEFLGDAVLQIAISDCLFNRLVDIPEGVLTKLRASIVNSAVLAEVARRYSIGDVIEMSKGEESSGGRSKGSILADCVEAIFGACYVECGFDAARGFVTLLLGDEIDAAVANPVAVGDYKSSLQEYLARGSLVPTYEMTWEGPDHARKFYAKVYADEDLLGVGSGVSKKQAQQEAAKDALIQLGIGA